MALQLTTTLPSGRVATNSYIKVSNLSNFWFKLKSFTVLVSYFKDRAASLDGMKPEDEKPFNIDSTVFDEYFPLSEQQTAGNDIQTLIYRYLRHLPEFEGAENVLEGGQNP